jgi:hypothetical protein
MTIIDFIRGVYQGNVSVGALLDVAKGSIAGQVYGIAHRHGWDTIEGLAEDLMEWADITIETWCNDGCSGAPQDCERCPLVQYMEFDREDEYVLNGWLGVI